MMDRARKLLKTRRFRDLIRPLVADFCLWTGCSKSVGLAEYCANRDFRWWAEWLRRHGGVEIGANTSVNPAARFMDHGLVRIGRNCSISFCTFVTHSGGDRLILELWGHAVESRRPIVVGDNCLIGCNVTLMPGTVIENDCFIGAGSVVSGRIAAGTVMKPPLAVHAGCTEDYVERLVRRAGRAGLPAASPKAAPLDIRTPVYETGRQPEFGSMLPAGGW